MAVYDQRQVSAQKVCMNSTRTCNVMQQNSLWHCCSVSFQFYYHVLFTISSLPWISLLSPFNGWLSGVHTRGEVFFSSASLSQILSPPIHKIDPYSWNPACTQLIGTSSSDLRDICRTEMWWRIEIHLLWMSRKRDHSLGHVIQCERFFFVNERFRSWDGGHHCRKSDTSNSPSCTSCHCKVRLVICVMLPCSTSSCFLLNPKP